MNAKRMLALSLVIVMVFAMFAGCAKSPTEGGVAAGARTDIIVADLADAKSMDPHAANDGYSARVFNQIYDSLLKQGPDLDVQPALAKSWDIKSPTEIVFHLEKGVKFHNGDELKATDVKFSIDRMVKSAQVSSYFNKITDVTVIDNSTVSVKTSEPYAPLLFNLAGTYGSIVSEKAITEGGDKYGENPIGTGPMKFKEWAPNDHISFTRNDDYFKGAGRATSLTIRVVPEDSMRTIALENGEVDFLQATPAVDIKRIAANDKLTMESFLSQSAVYLGFNCKKAPFADDIKIRQAISYAVDRQSIVDVVLEGEGQVINTMLSPEMPGADTTIDLYPYSLEKAKTLMAESGKPDGFKTQLWVSGDAHNKAAQIIQANLAQIGVEVVISVMEFGALLEQLNGAEHDMYILSYGAAGNPDATMSNVFYSQSSASSGNRSFYSNKAVDALIDKARTTMEWKDREPLYKEVQKLIMEDAPILPLYSSKSYYGRAKSFEGAVIYKNAKHDFYNAIVTK